MREGRECCFYRVVCAYRVRRTNDSQKSIVQYAWLGTEKLKALLRANPLTPSMELVAALAVCYTLLHSLKVSGVAEIPGMISRPCDPCDRRLCPRES